MRFGKFVATALLLTLWEALPARSESIDPLVVSASLTPRPLSITGSSVIVLTREDIARSGELFLLQILRGVPGLAVSQTGPTGGVTNIRIRGGESDHTLVLINGVKFNDPTSRAFDFAHLLASDIERVEIVKGPQSVIHGADALAGVISITTRKNPNQSPSHAQAEFGSFDSLFASASRAIQHAAHSIHLGGSFYSAANMDISKNAGAQERDAYQNFNWEGHYSVSARDRFRNLELFDLNLWARGTEVNYDGDSYGLVGTEFIVSDGLGNDETDYTELGVGGTARTRRSLADGILETALVASHYASNRQTVTLRPSGASSATETRTTRTSARLENSWLHQKGSFTFLVGRDEESFLQLHNNAREEDIETLFIAAESLIFPVKNLSLTAGIRHEDNSNFETSTTWRTTLALLRRIQNINLRLHGSYGTAVQNPTLYDLYGFFGSGFMPNPNLEAEEGESFDLGLEISFPNPIASLDFTYFEGSVDNEIALSFFTLPNGQFSSTPRNRKGRSDRRGFEITASFSPYDNLALHFDYTYTRSRTSSNDNELRRPKNQYRVSADWRISPRWKIYMDVNYTGSQRDSIFTTTGSRPTELSAITLASLQLSYEMQPQRTVYLRLENILDDEDEEVYSYARRGFGVYGGVKAHF